MRKLLVTVLLCILALPAIAQENHPSDNPLSAFTKRVYGFQKGTLLRSAEKMPEENYSFKPVDTVRTYGQVVGHLAGAQYLFCSKVLDEEKPGAEVGGRPRPQKADLIAALKTAFAYCDKAYDAMTDASGGQIVKLFGTDTPRLGVLNFNNVHNMGAFTETCHLHEDQGHRSSYPASRGKCPHQSRRNPNHSQKK